MVTTNAVPVDPSNAEAFRAWDGGDGDYWSAHEHAFEHSLHRYQEPFFEAASIRPTDNVLDIGCGTGGTTREAAKIAAPGSALGVDLSSRMLERARRHADEDGISNVRFLQADAQIHPFDGAAFDVGISRTAAMFFGDQVAALANIGRALRPRGRIVLLVWQSPPQNHWFRDFISSLAAGRDRPLPPAGAPGPFSLADREKTRSILSDAGYTGIALEGVEELMWFGETPDDAYAFVRGMGFTDFMLQGLGEDSRRRALADLRASIEAHATGDGVVYPSAAWLVTARR